MKDSKLKSIFYLIIFLLNHSFFNVYRMGIISNENENPILLYQFMDGLSKNKLRGRYELYDEDDRWISTHRNKNFELGRSCTFLSIGYFSQRLSWLPKEQMKRARIFLKIVYSFFIKKFIKIY